MRKLTAKEKINVFGGEYSVMQHSDFQSITVLNDSVYTAGNYTFYSDHVTYNGTTIFSGHSGSFYINNNLCNVSIGQYGPQKNGINPILGNMYRIQLG